jgi:hypothetical protein
LDGLSTQDCAFKWCWSAKCPGAGEKHVERKANDTAVIDDLRDAFQGLIAVEPHGGTMARANVASPFEHGDCCSVCRTKSAGPHCRKFAIAFAFSSQKCAL